MPGTYIRTFYHELGLSPLSRNETIKARINAVMGSGEVKPESYKHYATLILGNMIDRQTYDDHLLGK